VQSSARLKSHQEPETEKPKMRLQTWCKYVPHEDVAAHLALGWEESSALVDTHHGEHATLCVWEHEGDPPNE
jgi:hypothetical protein